MNLRGKVIAFLFTFLSGFVESLRGEGLFQKRNNKNHITHEKYVRLVIIYINFLYVRTYTYE